MEPPDDYAPSGVAMPVCVYTASARPVGGEPCALEVTSSKQITATAKAGSSSLRVDHALQAPTADDLVRQSMQPLLQAVVDGVHGCILCGGSALSPHVAVFQGDETTHGLVAAVLSTLIALLSARTSTTYFLRVSFVEIYEETAMDLLSPKPVVIPHIDHATRVGPINSVAALSSVLAQARMRRHAGATAHGTPAIDFAAAIFRVHIKQVETTGSRKATYSRLDVINLPALNHLNESMRLAESPLLTKSLVAFESLLRALSTPPTTLFPPYDVSLLTDHLRQALGGDCSTMACIGLVPNDFDGTKASLLIASLLQQVHNFPIVHNDLVDGLQRRYERETQSLKGELAFAKTRSNANNNNSDESSDLVSLLQTTHELEGRCIRENLEKIKLREHVESLQKALAEYRTKYQSLVEGDVSVRQQLLESEREKLRLSKALVDLQLAHASSQEDIEKNSFALTTKLLNAENDVLELQMREEEHAAHLKRAQDAASAAMSEKRELAIEFVALKTNFVALRSAYEKEVATHQQVGLELLTLVNQKKTLLGQMVDLERGKKDALELRAKDQVALDTLAKQTSELHEHLAAEKQRTESLTKTSVELELQVKALRLEADARQLQYEKAAQEALQERASIARQLQQQAQDQATAAQARIEALQDQVKTLTSTTRQMARQILNLETVVTRKASEIEALTQTITRQAMDLEATERDYRAKLEQLLRAASGAAPAAGDDVIAKELVDSFRKKEADLFALLRETRLDATQWQRRTYQLHDVALRLRRILHDHDVQADDVPKDMEAWASESAARHADSEAAAELWRTKFEATQHDLHLQLEKNLSIVESYKGMLAEKSSELTRLNAECASIKADRDRLLAQWERSSATPTPEVGNDSAAQVRQMQETLLAQIAELRQLHAAKQTDAVELSAELRALQKENQKLKKLHKVPSANMAHVEETERRCAELLTRNIMLTEEVASFKQLLKATATKYQRRLAELQETRQDRV
ncbi:hypothetical protein SDRG_09937 [Saprolegnia diclina VS20]|uniref:Kinesin motor domain-containing protein n=1 Tax=Saprolegnia diclina (strain VS20) TaxID=1156394 RepID=T0Q465_SAPDV|nr:hypothetical protein SDRG_09937 [Saprolegnia diclina VS20]EQC32624.1 hypothetical protein SDRG_09937 [Saprolegnia diclina VS20]|eukprot:XP_008614125.1 hypothetical protein SDRG_09937 [Saprolegnia diclina VS20]